MYAQGMTVREIQRFLEEQYKVEVSADLISTVTDSVLEDVVEWQNRPLEPMYAVVFFDALRVKIRDDGTVKNKAVYLALGIQRDGTKDVLGIWIQQSEGAKFWLSVMNELNHRGLKDILVAVIDGLKGFPEAISAVYPESEIQTCIVHLIRNSLSFCNWKERKPVAAELKKNLQRRDCRTSGQATGGLCARAFGKKDPCNRSMLAQSMGTSGAIFRLSQRTEEKDLFKNTFKNRRVRIPERTYVRGNPAG